MTKIVQLIHPESGRAVALVDGAGLRILQRAQSVADLAQEAVSRGESLRELVHNRAAGEALPYDDIWSGDSDWKLLPPIDHPHDPARCLITGTGLTHRASADNRQAMHAGTVEITDSMRMYQWGIEAGRPATGSPGVSPEWFWKGTGTLLRAHNEALEVPEFAEDGGEEAEIAGLYIIDDEGTPRRVGMAQGNEFSDHVLEKRNYLYLASSKMRQCSIGPELVVDPDFTRISGTVRIHRGSALAWEKPVRSGEENMCHSLENIEHHHFKFPNHRQPGDVHVHFFGASAFSFGEKVKLEDGDVMEIAFDGFGRALRNPIRISPHREKLVRVAAL